MPGDAKAPRVNNRFACIVDRDAVALAAVISSYLFKPGSYLPLFLFPRVEVPKADDAAFMTESYVANLMADQDGILIGNALARIGRSEYVILAGLTEAQKSYLVLPKRSKLIEIVDLSDIPPNLSPLTLPTRGELRCRTSDLLNGLFVAQKRQKRLVIDEGAQALPEVVSLQKGMVVVENVADASPVVAINYANSVGASVLIVDSLARNERRDVQGWIQDWKENDDHAQFEKLKDAVWRRIRSTSFTQFEYATFFTEGLPYSLILENVIPCSHIHLSLRPDLFILNSIMSEDRENFHAAVVFSPVFFPDEETNWLCDFFTRNKCCLRALIGEEASLANFDFHAQYFPYDLLHICSHGGEVDGYEMSEQFVDRDGNAHLVEFDEVVGFTPVPDKLDMVAVHRKVFPRKLDGFAWMSAELEKQTMPGHVCLAMWKCMIESRGQRKKKDRIAMSCAIACVDSIHQGQFNTLGSQSSPLIFNNTCWSSYEVASFFLACGATGYIGTLWAIDNQAAVVAAQTFYENLFFGPVLTAFQKAMKAIDATGSKDIYIYWGFHFTTLSPGQSVEESQSEVCKKLVRAVDAWVRKIESTKSAEVRTNSIKVLKSILRELLTSFDSGEMRTFELEVKSRLPELSQTRVSRGTQEHESPSTRSSTNCPIECRTAKRRQ